MLTKKIDEITIRYRVELDEDKYKPIFNVSPTLLLPVITNTNPRKLLFFRWGLIPLWAKDEKIGMSMINARAETLSEKHAYKNLLKNKRCLVLADGFFEWQKKDGKKIPYCIRMKNDDLFAFAGIWDQWKNPDGETIFSFSIITTNANEIVAPIHDRMPVILDQKTESLWLFSNLAQEEALSMLKPFSSEKMKVFQVSDLVNSSRNNFEEILTPI